MILKEECVDKGMPLPAEEEVVTSSTADVPEEELKRREPFKYDVTVYLTTMHHWDEL